jgi:hypothetical protein
VCIAQQKPNLILGWVLLGTGLSVLIAVPQAMLCGIPVCNAILNAILLSVAHQATLELDMCQQVLHSGW